MINKIKHIAQILLALVLFIAKMYLSFLAAIGLLLILAVILTFNIPEYHSSEVISYLAAVGIACVLIGLITFIPIVRECNNDMLTKKAFELMDEAFLDNKEWASASSMDCKDGFFGSEETYIKKYDIQGYGKFSVYWNKIGQGVYVRITECYIKLAYTSSSVCIFKKYLEANNNITKSASLKEVYAIVRNDIFMNICIALPASYILFLSLSGKTELFQVLPSLFEFARVVFVATFVAVFFTYFKRHHLIYKYYKKVASKEAKILMNMAFNDEQQWSVHKKHSNTLVKRYDSYLLGRAIICWVKENDIVYITAGKDAYKRCLDIDLDGMFYNTTTNYIKQLPDNYENLKNEQILNRAKVE